MSFSSIDHSSRSDVRVDNIHVDSANKDLLDEMKTITGRMLSAPKVEVHQDPANVEISIDPGVMQFNIPDININPEIKIPKNTVIIRNKIDLWPVAIMMGTPIWVWVGFKILSYLKVV